MSQQYQVLARKYRPKSFHELVGQTHVSKALINAIDHNRLHHAYLFTGTRGVGKTTIARILSKCLNCESGITSTPCGVCNSCIAIDEGRYIDLIEIDAASRTKVEDTRELIDNVPYAPTQGRYKVYLIDEVHMLSTHSFNALLKTLEEPPEHVKFLLATTDPQKLPITIISRCLQFVLRPLTQQAISDHLANILTSESVDFTQSALWQLANAAKGSVRDALSLTDQAIAFGQGQLTDETVIDMLGLIDSADLISLVSDIYQGDTNAVSSHIEQMRAQLVDAASMFDGLSELIHQLAMTQILPNISLGVNDEQQKQISKLAQAISPDVIQLYYQIIIQGREQIKLANTPLQALEMCILRLLAFRPLAVNEVPVVNRSVLNSENTNFNNNDSDLSDHEIKNNVSNKNDSNQDNSNQDDSNNKSSIDNNEFTEKALVSEQQTFNPNLSDYQASDSESKKKVSGDVSNYLIDESNVAISTDSTSFNALEVVYEEGDSLNKDDSKFEDNIESENINSAIYNSYPTNNDSFDNPIVPQVDQFTSKAEQSTFDSTTNVDSSLSSRMNVMSSTTLPDINSTKLVHDLDELNDDNSETSLQPNDKPLQPEINDNIHNQKDGLSTTKLHNNNQAITNNSINCNDKHDNHTELVDEPLKCNETDPRNLLKCDPVKLEGEWTPAKWDFWLYCARESNKLGQDQIALARQGIMIGDIHGKSEFKVPFDTKNMQLIFKHLAKHLHNEFNSEITISIDKGLVNDDEQILPQSRQEYRLKMATEQAEKLLNNSPVIEYLQNRADAKITNIKLLN